MKIWERFPEMVTAVRQKHEEVGLYGHHDWIHACRVGEIARRVSLNEWKDEHLSHLAGLAGLAHNADRIIQKQIDVGYVVPEEEEALILSWLSHTSLNTLEIKEILDAVLKHDGKNSSDDSQLLIALMDGDRIVNLGADVFVRAGQYRHDLPAVDYKRFLGDSEATYRSPKSALRNIAYMLEWADPKSSVYVRTQLARRIAEERVKIFHIFFNAISSQLEEEGVHPYPF